MTSIQTNTTWRFEIENSHGNHGHQMMPNGLKTIDINKRIDVRIFFDLNVFDLNV